MKYVKITALSVLLVAFLSACASFKEPTILETKGVELKKIEGKKITFSVGVKVLNPNWYALKIKKSTVDIYVEDKFMGQVFLEDNLKFKAKKENELNVPLQAVLEDGALLTALRYANAEQVAVRIEGKVKGGVWFFSKRFPVNEKRTVSGKDLRLTMPPKNG
jgi:LEA14-like dessication related protein